MPTKIDGTRPGHSRVALRIELAVGVIATVLAALLLSIVGDQAERTMPIAVGAGGFAFGLTVAIDALNLGRHRAHTTGGGGYVLLLDAFFVGAAAVITLLLTPILLGIDSLGPLSSLVGEVSFVAALIAFALSRLVRRLSDPLKK